jgi:DNA-binding XRE family transcriptional regulator
MRLPISTPQDVGLVVRAARKAEKLRQDDAAGAIGVSDVFLYRLEKGSPGARLDKALQVIKQLGIHLYVELPDDVYAQLEKLKTQKSRVTK